MTSLPSGLASISSQFDDSPQVRGAVDMAMRLRRVDALSALAEMDAPLIDVERPADVERAVAFGRMVREREEGPRKRCGKFPYRSEHDILGPVIDRHAALVIGSAYRSADRR